MYTYYVICIAHFSAMGFAESALLNPFHSRFPDLLPRPQNM